MLRYTLSEAEVKKALHNFDDTVSARVETYEGRLRAATVELTRLRINMLFSGAADQRSVAWHKLWSVLLRLAKRERCQVAVVYETAPRKALFIWPLYGQLEGVHDQYGELVCTKKTEAQTSAFPAFRVSCTQEQYDFVSDSILNPGIQLVS